MQEAENRRLFIKLSISEVFFWQLTAMTAVPGSIYFLGLLILLNATDFHFTLLTVILQSVALMQVFSAILLKRISSIKKFTIFNFAASRLILPAFILVILFAPSEHRLILIYVFVVLYAIFFGLGSNAHISWMQDRVPKHFLGRFYAYRDFNVRIVILTFGFAIAIFYDLFSEPDKGFNPLIRSIVKLPEFFSQTNKLYALIIIFVFGSIAGFISLFLLTKHPRSSFRPRNKQKISLFIAEPFKDKNFKRVFFFLLYWSFCASLGSPFWGPFLLKDLQMTFLGFQLYAATNTIGGAIFIRKIGRFIDSFGYVKVLQFAFLLGFINPLFFVIATPATRFIVIIEGITSGISWGIIAVATFKMMMQNSPADKKEIYLALFALAPGIGAIVASSSSYPLLELLKTFDLGFNPMRIIFALTAVMRLSAEIPLFLLFKKARAIKDCS